MPIQSWSNAFLLVAGFPTSSRRSPSPLYFPRRATLLARHSHPSSLHNAHSCPLLSFDFSITFSPVSSSQTDPFFLFNFHMDPFYLSPLFLLLQMLCPLPHPTCPACEGAVCQGVPLFTMAARQSDPGPQLTLPPLSKRSRLHSIHREWGPRFWTHHKRNVSIMTHC